MATRQAGRRQNNDPFEVDQRGGESDGNVISVAAAFQRLSPRWARDWGAFAATFLLAVSRPFFRVRFLPTASNHHGFL
jgi:hypothetical protein